MGSGVPEALAGGMAPAPWPAAAAAREGKRVGDGDRIGTYDDASTDTELAAPLPFAAAVDGWLMDG